MWMKDIKEKIGLSAVGCSKQTVGAETVKAGETSTGFQPPLELSQSQAFYSDPELHAFLDNLEKYGDAINLFLKNISPFESCYQLNQRIKDAFNSKDVKESGNVEEVSKESNLFSKSVDIHESVVDEDSDEEFCNDGTENQKLPCLDDLVTVICGITNHQPEKHDSVENEKFVTETVVEAEITNIDEFGGEGTINFWLDKDRGIDGLSSPMSLVCALSSPKFVVNEDVGVSYSSVVGTSYMLHSDEFLTTMSVVPNHLGCTIDCGIFAPNMPVVSRMLLQNSSIASQMLSVRKQVVDYVFLDDSTLSMG